MKTTITVSVRDGWLTFAERRWEGAPPETRHAQTIYIAELSDGRNPWSGMPAARVTVDTDAPQREPWAIEGVRAAEVMELIHAGSGTITREVENG